MSVPQNDRLPVSPLYLTGWLLGCLTCCGAAEAQRVDFNRDVRPILSDRCFKCHGPDAANQESEFRLDSFANATLDLGGYAGVVPGDLSRSMLHARIHDPEDPMPPREEQKQLSEADKSVLDRWIQQGAEFDSHWSFKPLPASVPIPDTDGNWARGPIDRFIANQFDGQGLSPADEASKRKWLRRVTFDLTGLPPTLAEIDRFLKDSSPSAHARVVDRLLDSDACAERLTSQWLDVARYSDTYGYQRDDERLAWPYRDWVIQAFRDRMPYDQFIRWQLAGDLLPDATRQQRLATMFNRLHSHKKEGGSDPEEFRVEYVADRVHTVAAAFLGLTMECCRCHDHKYDPLTMRDYYSLSAFFDNIDERGLISFFTDAVPTPAMSLPDVEQQRRIETATQSLAAIETRRTKYQRQDLEMEFVRWLETVPSADKLSPAKEAPVSDRPSDFSGDASGDHLPDDSIADDSIADGRLADKLGGIVVDLPLDRLDAATDKEAASHEVGKLKPDAVGALENRAGPRAITADANRIVPGRFAGAIELTGDDAVVIPEAGKFARHDPFSVSLWIWCPEVNQRGVIYRHSRGWDDAGSVGYELTKEGGTLSAKMCHFWPGDAIAIETERPIEPKRWYHVVVTYDGSSRAAGLKMFLNGEAARTSVVQDHLTRSITDWRGGYHALAIGSRYRDRGFAGGRVDQFQVFNRQISSLEVAQLFDGHALNDALNMKDRKLTPSQREILREHFQLVLDGKSDRLRKELRQARSAVNMAMDATPAVMVMRESDTPRQTYVLTRGAYDQPSDPVSARTPRCLPPMSPNAPRNRLGLAQWLTDPSHPLTSRVIVNRGWQLMFGNGLVRTPEDFGNQGEHPTHPQLLDWLARDFIASGWDFHRLLKQIALSATYRQSSLVARPMRQKDPENRWLARGTNQRLTAEMIRDNALAVSDLLVRRVGGPPVKPYDVALAYTPLPVDNGDKLYRRSLYTFWKRTSPAPVMMTLNTPTRAVCRVKREVTTTPLQALVMLNGPQFIEASHAVAIGLLTEHAGDVHALVGDAFEMLTSRLPSSRERQILTRLYQEQLEHFETNPNLAEALLKVGKAQRPHGQPAPVLAAATVLINSMMNLDECVRHQ